MTLAKGKKTEIQPFLALQPEGIELMRKNLGSFRINPWDMDRATVPTGGGVSWEVPDLDEGSKSVKSLEGIILHWMPSRRYYVTGLDEPGGVAGPPDCFSNDGIIGTGDPGGDCESCPMNEWGSGKNNGKACSEHRLIFLLTPDALLPILISVPTMSVKPFNQYLMRLASKAIMYRDVVTNFSLEKTQQKGGGLIYSKIIPKLIRRLSPEEVGAVQRLAFKPQVAQRAPSQALNG